MVTPDPAGPEWWCIAIDSDNGRPCRSVAKIDPIDRFKPLRGWQPLCEYHRRELIEYALKFDWQERWESEARGRIYVAKREKWIKIGHTVHVPTRLRDLSRETDTTTRPTKTAGLLDLIADVRGSIRDEHSLHGAMRAAFTSGDRQVGEWFPAFRPHLHDALRQWIDTHLWNHPQLWGDTNTIWNIEYLGPKPGLLTKAPVHGC